MGLIWSLKRKYDKIQPFYFEDDTTLHKRMIKLIKNPDFNDIHTISYMIDPIKLPINEMDYNDKELNNHSFEYVAEKYKNRRKYTMLNFIGYHEVRWYGIFRARLDEICNIIPEIIFNKSEKIYVTTLPNYPTCYVNFIDRSCGLTYAICLEKQN